MKKYFSIATAILFTAHILLFAATPQEMNSYDYFASGSKKYTELDNEGALADLEKAVGLNPNFQSALGLFVIVLAEQAIFYYQSKEYDKAIPYLNKLLRYVPDDKELRQIYEEAKSHIKQDVPAAQEIVSADDRQRQDFLEAWRNYMRIKTQGYSLRDRLTFLHKIFASYSSTRIDISIIKDEILSVEKELAAADQDKDFNVRFNFGLRKYKTAQYNEALAIWNSLKKDFPNHATLDEYITQAKNDLGMRISYLDETARKEFAAGNWFEAIRNWELALELDPSNLDTQNRLTGLKNTLKNDFDEGHRLYKQGLYNKAIEKWEGIVKRYPNYPGVKLSLQKANNELLTTTATARLDVADAHVKEALALKAENKLYESVISLRKAIAIDPSNSRALNEMTSIINGIQEKAQGLFDATRFTESQELWELLLKINPADKNAREKYNLCLNNYEQNQNKYFKSGEDAFNAGNYLEALDNFKKVLAVAPDNKQVLQLLIESHLSQGIVFYRTEKLDEAIDQWDRVLKLNPDNEKAKAYKTRALTKIESLRKLKTK